MTEREYEQAYVKAAGGGDFDGAAAIANDAVGDGLRGVWLKLASDPDVARIVLLAYEHGMVFRK